MNLWLFKDYLLKLFLKRFLLDLAVKTYVPLVVIGATNQADSLDIGKISFPYKNQHWKLLFNIFNSKKGLRRAGRFDQEIAIGIPDEKQRKRFIELIF